jgi:diguanylate cyclase (GGDEF)-like protein
LIDSLYLVPYVLMAVAGLHPSVRRSGAPVPPTDVSLTRARLVLLASVAVLTPAMMALEAGLGHSLAVPVIVGGTTVVFLLVVARMATLVDALEVSRAQLSHDAGHDSLTGLANRALLVHAIVATMASRRRLALVFIDLDHFKSVNDTFGHMAGDRLLIEAGNRLRASTERGFVARMGGDEFVVLLTDAEASAAEAVAARIAERLNERGVVDTVGPTLAASVGLAHWEPVDSAREDPFRTVETLLDRADVAMYEAKRSGRGRLVAIETDELVERRRIQPATTR